MSRNALRDCDLCRSLHIEPYGWTARPDHATCNVNAYAGCDVQYSQAVCTLTGSSEITSIEEVIRYLHMRMDRIARTSLKASQRAQGECKQNRNAVSHGDWAAQHAHAI